MIAKHCGRGTSIRSMWKLAVLLVLSLGEYRLGFGDAYCFHGSKPARRPCGIETAGRNSEPSTPRERCRRGGHAGTRAGSPARPASAQLRALPASHAPDDSESLRSLLIWVAAFASSHIGMSAIRRVLITDVFGGFLARDVLGIVGTGRLRLPDSWPGDSSGTNELFPDVETAGRQFYRMFYTLVSFATLGSAFSIYLGFCGEPSACGIDLGSLFDSSSIGSRETLAIALSYAIATLSGAFSLASLVNASPLGLMPSFRAQTGDEASGSGADGVPAGNTILGIARDDALKFDPRGLTRITRHPLILPVVPWGLATAFLAGGRLADAILFGGLSVYAIAGCYCQDLRVLREEGSVGTTFAETSGTASAVLLRDFYDQTSFLPLGAVLEGRQSWDSVAREFPTVPFLLAVPSAFAIQTAFLRFLGVEYHLLL